MSWSFKDFFVCLFVYLRDMELFHHVVLSTTRFSGGSLPHQCG